METLKYELKYCEGCGTLKLRPVASGTTYCRWCEDRLARFAFGRRDRGSGVVQLPGGVKVKSRGVVPQLPCGNEVAGRAQ